MVCPTNLYWNIVGGGSLPSACQCAGHWPAALQPLSLHACPPGWPRQPWSPSHRLFPRSHTKSAQRWSQASQLKPNPGGNLGRPDFPKPLLGSWVFALPVPHRDWGRKSEPRDGCGNVSAETKQHHWVAAIFHADPCHNLLQLWLQSCYGNSCPVKQLCTSGPSCGQKKTVMLTGGSIFCVCTLRSCNPPPLGRSMCQ